METSTVKEQKLLPNMMLDRLWYPRWPEFSCSLTHISFGLWIMEFDTSLHSGHNPTGSTTLVGAPGRKNQYPTGCLNPASPLPPLFYFND